MSLFDELGDDRPDKINIKPFHSIDKQDPKELLNWCVKVVETLEKQAVPRTAKSKKNLEAYRGSVSSIRRYRYT